MIQDLFDDSNWDGDGDNIVPWRLGGCTAQQVTSSPDEGFNSELPNIATLSRQTLTEFEALMLGEISNDGYSGYGTRSVTPAVSTASSSDDEAFFPFMELPLEIRLQVYRWLHLMTPIRLTQFAPWYPNPVSRTYQVRAIIPNPEPVCDLRCDSDEETLTQTIAEERQEPQAVSPSPPLLSPWRPHCCIPTAVLQTSKQMYFETRQLPFLENEFVFVNWFSSGLWAARSFLRGLRPWQTQTMRYARLELLSRDLLGRYVEEWKELCGSWAVGLRGLRLKILSGGGGSNTGGAGGGAMGSWVVAGLPQRGGPTVKVRNSDGGVDEWIENGLKLLKQLRRLEVELSVADWDDKTKLDWCLSLEEVLNESKTDTEHCVRVSCVEKDARD
ncbi:hypothetical protein AAE478_009834 [Parahypoxylon ruwenzoriense]